MRLEKLKKDVEKRVNRMEIKKNLIEDIKKLEEYNQMENMIIENKRIKKI